MNRIDSRLVNTIILLAILALLASPFADARGLVPCGGASEPPCSPCHIFILVQNIYNFIIYKLAPPIAALMFIYGGFLMVVPGVGGEKSATALTKGKKIITNTLIGLAIIFFAWLGIDTIIKILVGKQDVGSGVTAIIRQSSTSFGPWNAVQCTIPSTTQQKPEEQSPFLAPEKVGISSGALSGIANELKKKVLFSSSADCRDTSGNPVSAQTTINELSAGQAVTVCNSGCTGKSVCTKSNTAVSGTLLAGLDTAAKSFKFTVTSITTGSHSAVSCHYAGNCVDIVPTNKSDYESLRTQLAQFGAEALCEGNSGKVYNSCIGVPTSDPINHIHARWN